MKIETGSRILRGIRLFLFSTVGFASALASDPATIEGRINRNAYPLARYGSKYALLPKGVEGELRARIAQVLAPIRLAPASWFRAALGHAPSTVDRRRILESAAETEIWKCQGEGCAGCPGNETSGCVLGNAVAGGIGVVALIHPCLYGEGKCPKGASADLGAWTEKFVLGVAYSKSGLPKDGSAFRKAAKASAEWLRNTSRSVNLLLGACPGPYATESLKFLFGVEAASLPNAAILRCGQAYLADLRALPARCKALGASLRAPWARYEKDQLRPAADILRCDDYCLKMLCRKAGAGTVFTRFSGKPALLLGDGACEGETPKLRGKFIRDALPSAIRGLLEPGDCLPPEERPGDGASALGNGPEVQLVE